MSRPLHILYAVHGYKPAYRVGGPILSVAAAAEALVKKGHRVTVFTSNSNLDEDLDVPLDQPVTVDGVDVWYFRRRPLMPAAGPAYFARSMGFLYTPRMAAALRAWVPRVDLVHTHLPFVYPTLASARAALRWRKPLFYHQRGVFNPGALAFRGLKKRLYIRAVELPIMKRATTLIALTETERQSYRRLGADGPCAVIPNGITSDDYRTTPQKSDDALGLPRGAAVILFLGRLHPIKGADLLVTAFVRIARKFPDAVLVMAGPDERGLTAELATMARAAGVGERVLFPGMVTGARKLDLLARADLFCLPSQSEGFSMAVLEAMASRTAVLLSPACGFPEAEAAGAGLVAERDPEALAEALATLLRDRVALQRMGERGLGLVRARYRWDAIVDRLLETYHDGIERRRQRRA